jgi:hypothetical protein
MAERSLSDPACLAIIYRGMAIVFWNSAKVVGASLEINSDGTPARVTAIPFYFLVTHAAELLLKSALLKRGFQDGDLKRFDRRHNLAALLEELQEKGVSVNPGTVRSIHGLHSQHKNHALRCSALLDDGQKTYMPPLPLMFSMLEELLLLTRISTQGI